MDTYDASMSEPVAQITLPGAVVLVTGGSRGIGAGIARAFLAAGARVIVCGRKTPDADTLPQHVELVAALPMNAAGKVQKFALRDTGPR